LVSAASPERSSVLSANNSLHKGGVLFVDSADKATRFVQLCDAFNVPLLFLSDVPGFMVGAAVEKQGIIRHGAKMITAIAEATGTEDLCRWCVRPYGAGLYAMAGPGFEPDATIALPDREDRGDGRGGGGQRGLRQQDRAIGDEAERAAFVAAKRDEYERDIDLVRLASELVIDAIVEPADLRDELIRRFAAAAGKDRHFSRRRHGVHPCLKRTPLRGRPESISEEHPMPTFRLSEGARGAAADRTRVRARRSPPR
jgi:acetyl-CoA carboxylase carboxyltransferase component